MTELVSSFGAKTKSRVLLRFKGLPTKIKTC
jgi:hypothetical protein